MSYIMVTVSERIASALGRQVTAPAIAEPTLREGAEGSTRDLARAIALEMAA